MNNLFDEWNMADPIGHKNNAAWRLVNALWLHRKGFGEQKPWNRH
jgi:hypothetical protein